MGRARDNGEYALYLRSPHWRLLAARVKIARGNKCERCGSGERLDTHHLTYDRIGHERPEDLMVLCRECHLDVHERPAVNWAFTDNLSIKEIRELVPDYEDGIEYNDRQLGYLADKLLLLNPDDCRPVLFPDRLRSRVRREIYVATGTPDPSIEEGLYWRTHPRGRAWWSRREREDDVSKHSFYREAGTAVMGDYEWEPEPFKPSLEPKRPKKTFVMGSLEPRRARRRNRQKGA